MHAARWALSRASHVTKEGMRSLNSHASACYCSASAPKAGLLEHYNSLVEQGILQQDEHQKSTVVALHKLLQGMVEYERQMGLFHEALNEWKRRRKALKNQLIMEEAEQEARRHLAEKSSETQRGSIWKWFSRKQRNRKVESGTGMMVARINREKKLDQLVGAPPVFPEGPKGIYIYGSVGCGKTMLMDMFYNAADSIVKHRRRLHFHAAMLEMHDWMHKLWKQQLEKKEQLTILDTSSEGIDGTDSTESDLMKNAIQRWIASTEKYEEEISEGNVLDLVADNFLNDTELVGGGARLLCFDEMQVNDVFTAVVLAGVFSRLINKGAVIVTTSNRAPSDLNMEGMQKELFDKFISELQYHCNLILIGSDKDYRRFLAKDIDIKKGWPNYFWPLSTESKDCLEQKWRALVLQAGGMVAPTTVPVMFGRTLNAPESCCGLARFSFDQLCDKPLGAADYVSLARNFHTVFITDIPVMSMRNKDKARRFITLLDELYNHRRQLICTAETSIDELFLGSEEGSLINMESLQFETEVENSTLRRNVLLSGGVAAVASSREGMMSIQALHSGREELFAFQRAVSRLIEMQTRIYLQAMDLKTEGRPSLSEVARVEQDRFLLHGI